MITAFRQRLHLVISTYRKQLHVFFFIVALFVNLLTLKAIITVDLTSNDECLWVPVRNSSGVVRLVFNQVKPGGVSDKAGIKNGDTLIAISGVKITGSVDAQKLLNAVDGGKAAEYTVKRGTTELETRVVVKKLINIGNLALAVFIFFWLLVSFPVVRVHPEGVLQNNFFGVGITLSLFMSYIVLKPAIDAGVGSVWAGMYGIIWAFSGGIGGYLYCLFFLRFPSSFTEKEKKNKRIIAVFSIVYSIAIFIRVISILFSGRNDALGYSANFDPSIGAFIGFLVAGFFYLGYNYYRFKDADTRKRMKTVGVVYLLSMLGLTFSISIAPSVFGSVYNYPIFYTPIGLFAALPLAIGYSIFRYQMFDIGSALRNTIIYGTATILLAVLYLLTVYGIGQSLGSLVPEVYKTLVAVFAFVLFAILFESSREKFQKLLTARFYPEREAYERALLEFNSNISSVTGIDSIAKEIAVLFTGVFSFKKFGLYLYRQHQAVSIYSDGVELPANIEVDRLLMDAHIEYRLTTRTPLIVEPSQYDELFPGSKALFTEQEIYRAFPLTVRNRLIGIIFTGATQQNTVPGHRESEILSAIVSQIALAIENARLYEEEKLKDVIEKELELAKKIQQNLLPVQPPGIINLDICGSMIPAKQVGGDYFDFIPINENGLFVVIGDVSGKGLPASLYMSKIQTLVQVVCNPDEGPADILKQINTKIYSGLDRSSFITMSLAKIDGMKRTLSFSRAGHLPLLIAGRDEAVVVKPNGIGLGLNKGEIFNRTIAQEEIALQSGDIVLFYTDGLNETISSNGEFFGDERLIHLLDHNKNKSAQEIISLLWRELSVFRGDIEQHDDMTAVVIKIS